MGTIEVLKNSGLICAMLMSQSVDQLLIDMHQARIEGADIVEIRLGCIIDFKPERDLKLILENKPLPVVVVYRPTRECGLYDGDEQERVEALLLAKDLGADYIDLELEVAHTLMKENKMSQLTSSGSVIVSCYLDSLTSIKDLNHLMAKMQSTEANILKIVASAAFITDIPIVFDILSQSKVPVIAYCTGERGLISQLLCFKFGGFFVYGSIEENTIPGLPTIYSLRQIYGVKKIGKNTKVFGLISKPVSHSKGPILHNPTFREVGYNGVYVPMFVDDLKEFFRVYTSSDFYGFSVGFPYKEAIIGCCDEVHPLAQSIGAVNTIIRNPNDGKLIGYNTDCEAAITAIEDALEGCADPEALVPSPLAGKLFVLAGAGGAGRALAFGAKSRGARVIVFDIDSDRAKSLADEVSGEGLPFEDLRSFQPEKDAILANATPIGMHPNTDRIPVPEETLGDYKVVFDAVYIPRKTRLLKDAETAGTIAVSGVEMFVRQAAAQFSLFTGQKAPKEFMRHIVMEKF